MHCMGALSIVLQSILLFSGGEYNSARSSGIPAKAEGF